MKRSRRPGQGGPARSSGRRRLLALLVLVVAGLGGLLALRLARVANDLRDAESDLEQAGDLLEDGEISASRDLLARASDTLVRANGELYRGADIAVLGPLPGISQNLEALRESVSLALRIADGGRRTLTAAAPLEAPDGKLEVPLSSGSIPLGAVSAAQVELESLLGAMPGSAPDDSPLLLGPVREVRRKVYDEALGRRTQVAVLGRGLSLLAEMAGATGPRRYLIAVANSAEMRGGGGMILSYGVLQSTDGDFALTAFGRIDDLALGAPIDAASVPTVPTDYFQRWSGFDPLLRWRNATMAGDFTVTAPVLERMYTAATGYDVDGVIQVDPNGLAAILEGVGPVEVAELGTVTADNVVSLVLNDAYFRFPGIDERSDVLKEVAQATFDKLVNGQYDSLRPLAEALVRTVEGRHLLMHTVSTTPEARLRFFGATGELPDPLGPDAVHLTVQNVSGNKLDYYLDTALELSGDRQGGAVGHVQAKVTLTNTAPAGVDEPRYIFGPFNEQQEVGLYRGVVSLYLPAGTTLLGTSGDPLPAAPALQTEAGRPVVGFNIDVPAGSSRTVVLDLALAPSPPGDYSLTIVPSARVRPTTVAVSLAGGAPVEGEVVLDRTWRFTPGAAPAPVGLPLGASEVKSSAAPADQGGSAP